MCYVEKAPLLITYKIKLFIDLIVTYIFLIFQMKSTNFLVITYLFCAFGGAQEYDLQKLYTFPIEQQHQQRLQNTDSERLIRSIESQPRLNQSNVFLAAERGAFPNCEIYGRTYCTDIEGYPE